MKNLSYSFGHRGATTIVNASGTKYICLHNLVDRLMESHNAAAVARKSFIVNDIDPSFEIASDEQVLAYVMSNLLNNMINSSKDVCIRVEAIRAENGIHLRVRNNAAYYYSTVAYSFAPIIEAARQLGAQINILNKRRQGTIFTLSMSN